MNATIFDFSWGNLLFSVCTSKIDILPRITASALPSAHAVVINMGFLMFDLNLTLWGKGMRDFIRKERES